MGKLSVLDFCEHSGGELALLCLWNSYSFTSHTRISRHQVWVSTCITNVKTNTYICMLGLFISTVAMEASVCLHTHTYCAVNRSALIFPGVSRRISLHLLAGLLWNLVETFMDPGKWILPSLWWSPNVSPIAALWGLHFIIFNEINYWTHYHDIWSRHSEWFVRILIIRWLFI